jgi:DNA-binding NtrC family response regulator
MAVVWGTVKDHKGIINVKSTKDIGTVFTIFFPVTRLEAQKEETIPIDAFMGKKQTILLVDDVLQQRIVASKILERLNYQVYKVESGEKALDFLSHKKVDLVILDMIMDPGINGCQTYEEIIKIHPGQKAIIASGFSETEDVKRAQELGAGQYIKKPYSMEKLGMAVKAALNQENLT